MNYRTLFLSVLLSCFFLQAFSQVKPRLLVLTDIGGDPDDTQSLVRLLVYASEFKIEGIIASAAGTPGELGHDTTRADLIVECINAYGTVENRLNEHKNFPSKQHLLQVVKTGNPRRGLNQVGEGFDTEGSEWISWCANDLSAPLNIAVWGGSTDLAQALWRAEKTLSGKKFKALLSNLRVYDINNQDGMGKRIMEEYPGLFYVLSNAPDGADKREGGYRGMYLGGDEILTSREWILANVATEHGELGALYPLKTWTEPNPWGCMKEGDTPSWFYFLLNNLQAPEHPDWGGWGGRFSQTGKNQWRDAADKVRETQEARAAVWRWRPYFQAEFQARMDWCVKPFTEANHTPLAVVNGYIGEGCHYLDAFAGQTLTLDASFSADVDSDPLTYRWWLYREASDFYLPFDIQGDTNAKASFFVPYEAIGKKLHIILEVTDNGEPALTGFRRVVVNVKAAQK